MGVSSGVLIVYELPCSFQADCAVIKLGTLLNYWIHIYYKKFDNDFSVPQSKTQKSCPENRAWSNAKYVNFETFVQKE